MNYKTITVSKTVNLGNEESQKIEITAEIDSTCEDYLMDCLSELNSSVTDALTKFKQQHDYAKELDNAAKKKTSPELPW